MKCMYYLKEKTLYIFSYILEVKKLKGDNFTTQKWVDAFLSNKGL